MWCYKISVQVLTWSGKTQLLLQPFLDLFFIAMIHIHRYVSPPFQCSSLDLLSPDYCTTNQPRIYRFSAAWRQVLSHTSDYCSPRSILNIGRDKRDPRSDHVWASSYDLDLGPSVIQNLHNSAGRLFQPISLHSSYWSVNYDSVDIVHDIYVPAILWYPMAVATIKFVGGEGRFENSRSCYTYAWLNNYTRNLNRRTSDRIQKVTVSDR